jgi:hypothetical protein
MRHIIAVITLWLLSTACVFADNWGMTWDKGLWGKGDVPPPSTSMEQIWYSGAAKNKFLIDFSGGFPNVICGGAVDQGTGTEGSANFTDPVSGQLKLYTDGIKIFNGKTNRVLENGANMGGHASAGEAAMIVPVPGANPDLFYIFTNTTTSVYYSIADLSKGPNGTVTILKQLLASNTGEAIGVVPHANGDDFWVLVFNTAAKVDAYRVDSSGIARLPVSSNTGFSGAAAVGSITHSPDYNTLSLGWGNARIVTANIDRATGILSNMLIRATGAVGYASAFSPDATKLYYANGAQGYSGTPWQLDLNTSKLTQLSTTGGFGGPKLALDGKIYWTRYNQGMLSVVENPNATGTEANFSLNALSLNGCTGSYNLPNQTGSFLNFIKPVDYHKTIVGQGQSVGNIDFGNTLIKLGEIWGTKWDDENGNGIRDNDEQGIAGVTIYLDLNENGVLDSEEPRQVTDEQGKYKFANLEQGTYIVREVVPDGYRQTFPHK